jgi:hypothetical protein
MISLKFDKKSSEGADKPVRKERRSGHDRRAGGDRRTAPPGERRAAGRRARGRRTRDLYKNDLDRHLWSWSSPAAKQRRKKKKPRSRRRTMAGLLASAAGAAGAAGLSFFLYRKLREGEPPPDKADTGADLDEDDFED